MRPTPHSHRRSSRHLLAGQSEDEDEEEASLQRLTEELPDTSIAAAPGFSDRSSGPTDTSVAGALGGHGRAAAGRVDAGSVGVQRLAKSGGVGLGTGALAGAGTLGIQRLGEGAGARSAPGGGSRDTVSMLEQLRRRLLGMLEQSEGDSEAKAASREAGPGAAAATGTTAAAMSTGVATQRPGPSPGAGGAELHAAGPEVKNVPEEDLEQARVSNQVYYDSEEEAAQESSVGLSDRYDRLSEEEIEEAGMDPSMLETDGGFQAEVYRDTEEGDYLVAFRGTEMSGTELAKDAWADATQAMGMDRASPGDLAHAGAAGAQMASGGWGILTGAGTALSGGVDEMVDDAYEYLGGDAEASEVELSDQYGQAQKVAQAAQENLDGDVDFTGHSLGGGLAITAAAQTGEEATVFNAAGVHEETVEGLPHADQLDSLVQGYKLEDEILANIQQKLEAVGLGDALPVSAEAGDQTTLPAIGDTRSASTVQRHKLPQLIEAIEEAKKRLQQ